MVERWGVLKFVGLHKRSFVVESNAYTAPPSLKISVCRFPSCLFYKREGERLKDVVVPLLVGLAKIASSNRPADPVMVELPAVSLHCGNQIPQTLLIGQLPKHQRKQLIPKGITLDILVAVILSDEVFEMIPVQELD